VLDNVGKVGVGLLDVHAYIPLTPCFPLCFNPLLTTEDGSDLTHVLEMRSEVLASSLSDYMVSLCVPCFPPISLSVSKLDIHFSGLAAVMCWEAYRTCTLVYCYLL